MSGAIGDLVIGVGAIGQGNATGGGGTPANTYPDLPTFHGTTTIPVLTGDQIAGRIAAMIPNNWASDDAKAHGLVRSLLLTFGEQLAGLLSQVSYVNAATRLQTETAPELDLASSDFFGVTFQRKAGETDTYFAQSMIANLFKPTATRPAFVSALSDLTGNVPRLLEPWNVTDTGAWSAISYWNVDTVANPARWGNGSLRYQSYIETTTPLIPAIGANNPVLSWGTAYWNVPGYFFGIIAQTSMTTLYDLINRIKAEGTLAWVKIVNATSHGSTPPGPVTNLAATASGAGAVVLTWGTPTGTPSFSFTAFYRSSGTTQWITGPTVGSNSATVSGLQDNTPYDFEVITRNKYGQMPSSIVTTTTLKVAPGPATNLQVTGIGPTAATLSWLAPATGTRPFQMQARYRVAGTQNWIAFGSAGDYTSIVITGLQPSTTYEFDVTTTN